MGLSRSGDQESGQEFFFPLPSGEQGHSTCPPGAFPQMARSTSQLCNLVLFPTKWEAFHVDICRIVEEKTCKTQTKKKP